jgi:Flp pilus assembly protein TadD
MRALCVAFIVALGAGLAGCQTDSTGSLAAADAPPTVTVQDPGDVKYYPSDEPMRLATEHFDRGNFGIAAKYYEDATTKAPKDAEAWIGLAASYDRIGRFDLADRAYKQAIKLVGENTQVLNNLGYSYMLRGNYAEARRKLMAAHEREPENDVINNNLRLLDSSGRVVKRDGEN